MDRPTVGIIIPAFNESGTIEKIVLASKPYGTVIVVDDASSDATPYLAKKCGAIVISNSSNCGYDSALNLGFLKASTMKCEFIVTIDADGQHPAELIKNFLITLQDGADIVVGIRSKKQRVSENIFAFCTKFLYQIEDPMCGMKGYRLSLFNALGHFDSYKSIGTELMIFAAKNKFTVRQIKFQAQERVDEARFGRIFISNLKILRALCIGLFHHRHL